MAIRPIRTNPLAPKKVTQDARDITSGRDPQNAFYDEANPARALDKAQAAGEADDPSTSPVDALLGEGGDSHPGLDDDLLGVGSGMAPGPENAGVGPMAAPPLPDAPKLLTFDNGPLALPGVRLAPPPMPKPMGIPGRGMASAGRMMPSSAAGPLPLPPSMMRQPLPGGMGGASGMPTMPPTDENPGGGGF